MTRILVIEDADPLRQDIVEMLQFEGYEVFGAENGRIGVEMAHEHQPDLIICDIMMPELDGYGVLAELKKDMRHLITPFIFLTAKTDRSDIRQGMGLGADDYLTKPFVASELIETIEARLQKHKVYDELLQEKMRHLSDNILTALPHELRTPLNTIIGFSDMLISEADHIEAEQITEWSQYIGIAAQRLYRLVENYIMYIQIEIAMQDAEPSTANEEMLLDYPKSFIEYFSTQKFQQAGRDNKLLVHKLNDDATIFVSEFHLTKMLEEVLDNALKFSEANTPVIIETTLQDNRYYVSITDKGRGMTQEQINSIGAYQQFDRWLYEQQGSGFGLLLVKRLATIYRATFEIESGQGRRGTSVRIGFNVV